MICLLLKYAETFNPAYGDPGKAADCTNYVSQCLRAGGLPQDKNGTKDQKWWFDKNGSSE